MSLYNAAGEGSKVGVAGRRGKASEKRRANAETNNRASDVQKKSRTSTQTNNHTSVGTESRTSTQTQSEGVGMATTGTGTANPSVTSTAIQGVWACVEHEGLTICLCNSGSVLIVL